MTVEKGINISGELLFTKYGLSGTCILDVSEAISTAINRDHKTDVLVSMDLIPFLENEQLNSELEKRKYMKISTDERLVGILPNKLSAALKDIFKKNTVTPRLIYLRIDGLR